MSSDRFHRAAKDGLLDVISKATRNDANAKDDDSMTPVLWAAFHGHLDALRILCGRGGDPDKFDQFGNTALHLASAKGHLKVVDFLVKFGVNIYALDIDRHSAKDLAAINNRDDILRYLDSATASFEAKERKKAKAFKELAEKNCEKRMREYMKRQQKLELEYGDNKSGTLVSHSGKSSNVLSTLKQKIWSSQGNLNKSPCGASVNGAPSGSTKYSDLVETGAASTAASSIGTVQKKSKGGESAESGFKIGEMEPDGRRTVTSLTGLQRDSEILYVGTFSSNEDNGKRGKISDVFQMEENGSVVEKAVNVYSNSTLSRSFSQPDFLADDEQSHPLDDDNSLLQRPAGLFERPMLGSISFRRSVTAALSELNPVAYMDMIGLEGSGRSGAKGRGGGKTRSFLNLSDTDSDGGDTFSEDDHEVNGGGPIQRFLTVWGLDEYRNIFQKQQIDLETLMLLTEADLKSLGLPLGPFRKLTFAIQERRNALANPGPMQDTQL